MGMSEPMTKADRNLLLALSALPTAICLAAVATPGYSYFIDEFYYLSCARHLAWGYVDHPPLAAFLLALVRMVFGESVLAVRLLPALATGATVYLTGLIVKRLGGNRSALVLSGLSVGLLPLILVMGSFYSMNAFEPLFWTAVMLTLLALIQTGNSRLWLLVGLLVGLAFENKHTVVAYVAALGVAIVATDARRMLRDPWLYAGGAVALALALPNVLWQAAHGWPSIEFYRNAQLEKNVYSPPWRSFLALFVSVNPLAFPVWVAGLWALVRSRLSPGVRVLGVTALVVILEYLVSGSSRPDRAAAILPLLCAAGATGIERWAQQRPIRRFVAPALAALIAAVALVLLPLGVPLLSPESTAGYARALGVNFQFERGKTSPIPQLLADRTGWETFIDEIRQVSASLTPEERKQALIYVPDYGHAGALELWGPALGLPRVISGHNTFWHWSNGHVDSNVLIAVGADADDLRATFRDVRPAGYVTCDYCMSWRSHMPIMVARGTTTPVSAIWEKARHYE